MISIVIVSSNIKKLIGDCIESIIKSGGECEIVVVDNGSTDGTPELIQKKYKFVKLIKNKKNLGYTKANNIGAKAASGKYIMLLNPDTIVLSKKFIMKITKYLHSKSLKNRLKKENRKLGITGFKFFNPDGSLQPSAGNFPTLFRILADKIPLLRQKYGIQIRDQNFFKKETTVDWVSGSGFIVEKKVYLGIGGFDEKIFMYGEDYDLCYRLNLAGFQNYFFPSVRIMHYDSGKNIPDKKPYKYYAMRRGFGNFLKKYRTKENLFFYRAFVKLEAILFLTILPFRGFNPKIKSIWKTHLFKSLSRT